MTVYWKLIIKSNKFQISYQHSERNRTLWYRKNQKQWQFSKMEEKENPFSVWKGLYIESLGLEVFILTACILRNNFFPFQRSSTLMLKDRGYWWRKHISSRTSVTNIVVAFVNNWLQSYQVKKYQLYKYFSYT